MKNEKLNCAITMGDAAGIGPEVILKALAQEKIRRLANFYIIGNSLLMDRTARLCKIKLKGVALTDLGKPTKLVFGRSISAYGSLALDCIEVALELLKSKKMDALITAPVNKHTIALSSPLFRGHTEYLATATKSKHFAMMLVGGPLKVALVTRHMPLKDVAKSLSQEKVYHTLRLTVQGLKRYFAIRRPRIAVCGLNPHSGDKGTIGEEDIKVIQPAIIKAKHLAQIEGPLSADSIFYWALDGRFDAVVCMYHDQGLIPLKMLAFHQGVNLTLGLPFVRTSPDHGTAYEIAGKNKANPGSMIEAIKLAIKIGSRL